MITITCLIVWMPSGRGSGTATRPLPCVAAAHTPAATASAARTCRSRRALTRRRLEGPAASAAKCLLAAASALSQEWRGWVRPPHETPLREPRPRDRAALAARRRHGRRSRRRLARGGRERHGARLLAPHNVRDRDQRALRRHRRRPRGGAREPGAGGRAVSPRRARRRAPAERALARARGTARIVVADDPDRRRLAAARPLPARVLLRSRQRARAKGLHPGHRRMTSATRAVPGEKAV